MADNITILDSSQTARLVRATDNSSVFTQIVKIDLSNSTTESLLNAAMPAGLIVDDTATDLVSEGVIGIPRMTADRRAIQQLGEAGALLVRSGGAKTDTTAQAVMAAPGGTMYNYLCWVTVYNTSSSNTAVEVRDGTTVAAVLPLPAYGGAIFQPTYPLRASSNAAWNLSVQTAVTTAHLYGGGYKTYS